MVRMAWYRIESIAALIDSNFEVSFENPEKTIDLQDFAYISEIILNSSHAERSKNIAIIPVRTDMIVMATLITKFVLNEFSIKSLKLSTYSLKEGLLFEYLRNRTL